MAAVEELVRDESYATLTVEDVMHQAGIGRTIFYRHFDDLGDLLRRAGREAFEGLLHAEQELRDAQAGGRTDIARAAIEPAVAVYRRHGPLLRAIAEAAASEERIAEGQEAMRRRFDELVEGALREMPALAANPLADIAETARALNLMNMNYLLDAFGREPRVSTETAVRTLSAIWAGVIDDA